MTRKQDLVSKSIPMSTVSRSCLPSSCHSTQQEQLKRPKQTNQCSYIQDHGCHAQRKKVSKAYTNVGCCANRNTLDDSSGTETKRQSSKVFDHSNFIRRTNRQRAEVRSSHAILGCNGCLIIGIQIRKTQIRRTELVGRGTEVKSSS
jgi:hypothetical protein